MIYICIPAHNEERTIGVLLWKIRQVLADFPRDYHILVANDGSNDGTAEVLAPYQRVLPLTVFQTHRQRGYASALEQLLREAVRRAEYPKRDVVITLQADFTDDPDCIAAMMKKIEAGADLVCTTTTIPETSSRAHRWGRRLGGYLIGRKKWPEGVSDPLSGFRAYRVIIVKRALEQRGGKRLLTWQGWLANAELLREVAPHSRRNEIVETHTRLDRLQRSSRLALWPALKAMLGFARGAAGPLAELPFEASDHVHDARGRRRRGAEQLREELGLERAPRGRPQGNGRRGRGGEERRRGRAGEERPSRTRERPQPGEPRARGERPPRGERPARGERPPRGERAARGERPERPERPRREKPPRQPPVETALEEMPPPAVIAPESAEAKPAKKKRRRRRRRGGAPGEAGAGSVSESGSVPEAESDSGTESGSASGSENDSEADEGNASAEGGEVRKRRRSRRGRGRRGRRSEGTQAEGAPESVDSVHSEPAAAPANTETESNRGE